MDNCITCLHCIFILMTQFPLYTLVSFEKGNDFIHIFDSVYVFIFLFSLSQNVVFV